MKNIFNENSNLKTLNKKPNEKLQMNKLNEKNLQWKTPPKSNCAFFVTDQQVPHQHVLHQQQLKDWPFERLKIIFLVHKTM